jgi:hypothetical protein
VHELAVPSPWRLAELVRQDHHSLASIRYSPDGRFQTRALTNDALTREAVRCLADGLRDRSAGELPTLYHACGKARVGSTPLTNVFGMAGIPSYYQPVKTVVRRILTDHPAAPWQLPPDVGPRVFCKETFGPFTIPECLSLPLELLLDAGYPAEKVHLIILDREPASSLASWLYKWSHLVSEDTLVEHYVLAALNTRRVAARAKRYGVKQTHYIYELSKEPVGFLRALFERLDLADHFTHEIVTGWNERGDLSSAKSCIIFPSEPAAFSVPGLHGSDAAYRFHDRDRGAVIERYGQYLADTGVDAAYLESIEACLADLNIDAASAARIFQQPAQRDREHTATAHDGHGMR